MGKLVEIKTKPNSFSVSGFIESIADGQKRKDSYAIIKLMGKAMKQEPKIWGSSIIGFGNIQYKSPATGREVDWFKIGFSPRKANLSLHLGAGIQQHAAALNKLGKFKTGVGCLYINKLEDVNIEILEKIIAAAAR
jgi:Domain of unknown function (DU1801)